MLIELQVADFVIIDQQSISFSPGLNVISGETGAGKSIVLRALELILGARPKGALVRDGAGRWEVQALFDLTRLSDSVRAELPDVAQTDELVLCRSMNRSGRSKVFINGRLGTVALLEETTQRLMNICGQGHQARLLDPGYHLQLIDDYAGCRDLVESYGAAFRSWKTKLAELRDLEQRAAQAALRSAELDFIVEELAQANLRPGLRSELDADIKKLSNSERILATAQKLESLLNGEADNDGGLFGRCRLVDGVLDELAALGCCQDEARALLRSAEASLMELDATLRRQAGSIEVDGEQLEELREQLAEVARLERKYRTNDSGLAELLERSAAELGLIGSAEVLDELKAEVGVVQDKVGGLADKLSRKRGRAGTRLAKQVMSELAELNMAEAEVGIECFCGEFTAAGRDRLQLMIATNRGSGLRPLREIASGGELARIMLVLKKVLRDRTGVNVLVFDEVDTGVSGGVARAVGEKLKSLAASSQVICITHLPQVASLADRHLLVEKQLGTAALTVVRELDPAQQIDEIARMLAGYKITAASRESARELLASKV